MLASEHDAFKQRLPLDKLVTHACKKAPPTIEGARDFTQGVNSSSNVRIGNESYGLLVDRDVRRCRQNQDD